MRTFSLTHDEAVRRAALVQVTGYAIELELSDTETFRSRTTIGFTCSEPGVATFVELADANASRATLNGHPLPAAAFVGNRIALEDPSERNELVVEATLPCVTSGDGMHRYVDPADGATYVSAYCGMDLAQRVFACFDQPDLRAPITLAVTLADTVPDDWSVLTSGRPDPAGPVGRTWRFATTPAIPTYLFVVCAGPWHSVRWEHRGLPFGWHARRSLAGDLDATAPELKQITTACFDHFTEIFDEPFAFDSYDQVMAPGLNWGAMEMPGCITFRDELLFPGQVSEAQREQRAMIIAHEMAHMWFGDLVSLRWWEDAWLSESFADFMGFQVASAAAGLSDAWTGFTLQQKPGGYEADERRSTHPVAPRPASVVDVDTAFGNFDRISYAKGNSVLRQLVTWLGEETFLRGANVYLTRHRLGNAELGDFLAALDEVTDRDVRSWAEVWLRATGFDTLTLRREGDVPVLNREGVRPHRTLVTAFSVEAGGLVRRGERMLDIGADPVRLDDWAGLVVIPNSHDHTFARIRLDDESWQQVSRSLGDIDDAPIRSVLWATALDMVRRADLDPAVFLSMLGTHLPREDHAAVWEGLFHRTLAQVLPQCFAPAAVAAARAGLADMCAATLRTRPSLMLAATRGFVACTSDAGLLAGWLTAGRTELGVEVDTDLRWRLLHRLAELDTVDAHRIDAEEAAHPSTQAETGAARARAALPSAGAKQQAWHLLASDDVSNRIFAATADGFWVPEQAGLLAPYLDRYLTEAPSWAARRGQGFSQAIGSAFPRYAVGEAAVEGLRTALSGEVPTVLRRAWEDTLDDVVAAQAVRSRWA